MQRCLAARIRQVEFAARIDEEDAGALHGDDGAAAAAAALGERVIVIVTKWVAAAAVAFAVRVLALSSGAKVQQGISFGTANLREMSAMCILYCTG